MYNKFPVNIFCTKLDLKVELVPKMVSESRTSLVLGNEQFGS